MTTKHTHPMVFGRREAGCPRCEEMNAGSPAVRWSMKGYNPREDVMAQIRAHDCKKSKCGPVCTAFDW